MPTNKMLSFHLFKDFIPISIAHSITPILNSIYFLYRTTMPVPPPGHTDNQSLSPPALHPEQTYVPISLPHHPSSIVPFQIINNQQMHLTSNIPRMTIEIK